MTTAVHSSSLRALPKLAARSPIDGQKRRDYHRVKIVRVSDPAGGPLAKDSFRHTPTTSVSPYRHINQLSLCISP